MALSRGLGAEDLDLARLESILAGIPAEAFQGPARSQPEAAREATSASPSEPEDKHRLELRNGARLFGRVQAASLPFSTPYGALEVPVARLLELRLALRPDAEIEARMASAIERLGDVDFEEREWAARELVELAPEGLALLRQARQHADAEIRLRARGILEELEAALREDEAEGEPPILSGHDLVLCASADGEGTQRLEARLDLAAIAIETAWGRLEVPCGELDRVVFREERSRRVTVQVPASAVAPGTWVATGLSLRKGQELLISADGLMEVPNYGESCGPMGLARQSRGMAGFSSLALIGLIRGAGKSAPFLVGKSYRGRAASAGRLELGVAPFPYDSPTGSYTAKVETR